MCVQYTVSKLRMYGGHDMQGNDKRIWNSTFFNSASIIIIDTPVSTEHSIIFGFPLIAILI